MRPIGEFDVEEEASNFSGYLNYKDIPSEVEGEDGGPWTVWVQDEDKLAKAMAELRDFRHNPEDPKYAESAQEALKLEKKERKEEAKEASRWREENLGGTWRERDRRPGMITLALIITCIATFFVSKMGQDTRSVGALYISEKVDLRAKTGTPAEVANYLRGFLNQIVLQGTSSDQNLTETATVPVYALTAQDFLPELKKGQIWRIITPIFLHFTFLHILFNMFWLHSLGSMIESRRGTGFFIGFLILLAIFSNLAQVFISGPHFGGMSGVVYGLFGYVWMKGKFDPGDGMQMHQTTIIIMLAWFALCFTGIFGPIANWAHAGGLAVGALWGFLSARRWTGARG